MIFHSKKLHYLIPVSLAIGAFQVLVAVIALSINWMQLQEYKAAKAELNKPVIQEELK